MQKRELKKLLEKKVTQSMRRAAEKGRDVQRYQGRAIWTPDYMWYYRASRHEEVLEIDVFTRQMILSGERYPRYRVFLHDGKYDTWDNIKERWLTGTIGRLEYCLPEERYEEWFWMTSITSRSAWIQEGDRKRIVAYCKNGEEDAKAAVQYWQDYKKNWGELNAVDTEMSLVPILPKDFKVWAKKEALPQYIFYDYGRRVETGYCTHCGHEVPVKNPKYNQTGKCPRCRHEITYKSRKKAGTMCEEQEAGILQKTKKGYVYRSFKAHIRYENGDERYFCIDERIRMTFDKNFRKEQVYEFSRYKSTDIYRWHWKNYEWKEKVPIEKAKLYWRNLQILKDTKMQYSGIDLYARTGKRFRPDRYIEKIVTGDQAMEKLLKCGFANLAEAVLNGSKADYIEKDEKTVKKILNLRTEYYRVIAGKDITAREHEVLWEAQEVGIKMTYEEVKYLAGNTGYRNFAIYIRHTTVHKMIRYLKERLESNNGRIMEYHDYLQMAAGLGYNLDDPYVLYPKNMEERHRQFIEEQIEQDEMLRKQRDDEKDLMFKKTIKRSGWKELEMETDELFMRLPARVHEIRKEGNELHHCVATYIDRVVTGKTCIMFIRKKEDPDTPFYTIEIKNGKVIQCRGKHNADMTEEVKKFVNRWKRKRLQIRKAG